MNILSKKSKDIDWSRVIFYVVVIAILVICWLSIGVRIVRSADLTAKAGDIIYAETKTPIQAVKVAAKEIVLNKKIYFVARKGGFVFVKIQTDIPIMSTVQIDSVTTKQVASGTCYEKNYQCSWVEHKVDKDGKKVVLLIDIDGSELILPIEKVLRVWK